MPPLVILQDVKDFLNIRSTTQDAELSRFLATSVRAVEDLVGPLTPRTAVDEVPVGPMIVLPQVPVVTVTSVSVDSWSGVNPVDDTASWRLNSSTGVLRRRTLGGPLLFLTPDAVLTVTYVVGRADIPEPINEAILMQVRELQRTQRGAQPTPVSTEDSAPQYGSYGFIHPTVMELLRPYLLPPGVG